MSFTLLLVFACMLNTSALHVETYKKAVCMVEVGLCALLCALVFGLEYSFCCVFSKSEFHDILQEAISKATTLEEVERLNQLLKAGQIPGKAPPPQTNGNAQVEGVLR